VDETIRLSLLPRLRVVRIERHRDRLQSAPTESNLMQKFDFRIVLLMSSVENLDQSKLPLAAICTA